MNPFSTNYMPIENEESLAFRSAETDAIRKHLDDKNQTVLLGPEGVGKTSLLKTAFNRDYRAEKAIDNVLITPVTEFPSNLKDEEIYNHFTNTIISSIRILHWIGDDDKEEEMNYMLRECRAIRSEGRTPADCFEGIVNFISDMGYRIVIVVDNFEEFTSSTEVTMKHHETLRKMLEKSQYIVSTNYDLTRDSLPKEVSGSFYLSSFVNKVEIRGWSFEQTSDYIKGQLEGNEIQFSDKVILNLYKASGGIPKLVKCSGELAYEYIKSNGSEEGLKFKPFYEDERIQILLRRWSRILTPTQISMLRDVNRINRSNNPSAIEKTILRNLYLRGILNKYQGQDENGNIVMVDNQYEFCCGYFKTYSENGTGLEDASAENPFNADTSSSTTSIDCLLGEIIERIESGLFSREQMIELTSSVCNYLPDVTVPVDLKEDPSNEILERYSLRREYLDRLDPGVVKFISEGIQYDRTFENVTSMDFDFGPVFLSFCKAVELHLNKTIVPIIKRVSPYTTYDIASRRTIAELPVDKTLMIGVIYKVLYNSGTGQYPRAISALKERLLQNFGNKYNDQWWTSFEETFSLVNEIRNKHPHTSILNDAEGKLLLKKLFGARGRFDQSFLMKCINLYNDIMST